MVDAIKVEMTRDQLKHQIMVNELFKKSCPQAERELTDEALKDFEHANQMLEITKIHDESNRSQLRRLKAYLEHHDHDLECRIMDSQVMEINIRNYWNGIGDGFGFYIEKRLQDDYLIIDDDFSLHFEGEVHTPGVRYKEVIRSMAYADIHQFNDEFIMLAPSEPEQAFENIEKYKQFLIESYSAYYDRVENKGE